MASTKWIICYYLTEFDYKCASVAHRETYYGTREGAISCAQHRLRYSQFKYFDLIQQS